MQPLSHLATSETRDQHDSEASFVPHHPSVSFGGLCQQNGFDHRTDLLQGRESVSSASIAEPVIVPAGERIPNRSRTGATLIGSSPSAPATISWPRGASLVPPGPAPMGGTFLGCFLRLARAPLQH